MFNNVDKRGDALCSCKETTSILKFRMAFLAFQLGKLFSFVYYKGNRIPYSEYSPEIPFCWCIEQKDVRNSFAVEFLQFCSFQKTAKNEPKRYLSIFNATFPFANSLLVFCWQREFDVCDKNGIFILSFGENDSKH